MWIQELHAACCHRSPLRKASDWRYRSCLGRQRSWSSWGCFIDTSRLTFSFCPWIVRLQSWLALLHSHKQLKELSMLSEHEISQDFSSKVYESAFERFKRHYYQNQHVIMTYGGQEWEGRLAIIFGIGRCICLWEEEARSRKIILQCLCKTLYLFSVPWWLFVVCSKLGMLFSDSRL